MRVRARVPVRVCVCVGGVCERRGKGRAVTMRGVPIGEAGKEWEFGRVGMRVGTGGQFLLFRAEVYICGILAYRWRFQTGRRGGGGGVMTAFPFHRQNRALVRSPQNGPSSHSLQEPVCGLPCAKNCIVNESLCKPINAVIAAHHRRHTRRASSCAGRKTHQGFRPIVSSTPVLEIVLLSEQCAGNHVQTPTVRL